MAMLTLRKIRIVNFQSIKDLTLDLGRFTVLVGDSDQGKTAVMRAIRSVFTNPPGQDYIRSGAQKLAVVLEFSNGMRIAYAKGKSAGYVLQVNGDKRTYERVGRDVPPEIAELVRKWEFGGAPVLIQLQGQKETDFVLSAGGVTTQRGLDAIDSKIYREAADTCSTEIRKLRLESGRLGEELHEKRERAARLEPVEALVVAREKLRCRAAGVGTLQLRSRKDLDTRLRASTQKLVYGAVGDVGSAPEIGSANVLLRMAALEGVADASGVPDLAKATTLLKMGILTEIPEVSLDDSLKKAGLYLAMAKLGSEIWVAHREKTTKEAELMEVEEKLFAEGMCPLFPDEVCPVVAKRMSAKREQS